MDIKIGTLLEDRFEIDSLCNSSGGMGEILFVTDLTKQLKEKLVLKYCTSNDVGIISRFQREVRLMEKFHNPKIIEIVHSSVDTKPPYFIMKYYKNGDLSHLIPKLKADPELQKYIFNSMIDSIQALHDKGVFHRDIKPQNFLLDDNNEIVVSDFGLGVEIDSSTRNTTTGTYGGTEGYMPPEFRNGGFKYADARGDIYMLGKSFYTLLSDQDPTHIDRTKLHPALHLIIEKACDLNKDRRYQNLTELKQAIITSYNIILGKGENVYIKTKQILKEMVDKTETEKINTFIENLLLLKKEEQITICKDLPVSFFIILLENCSSEYLEKFLKTYQTMVEDADYPFTFAENIAKNMYILFSSNKVNNDTKSLALNIAIRAAYLMSRYAAMEICTRMICSVTNDTLSTYVSAVLINNNHTFIQDINLSDCKSDGIANTLSVIIENEKLANEQRLNKQNELNSTWGP